MLIENQKVEMKWNNLTKRYYVNKGYIYTHIRVMALQRLIFLKIGRL